ncbi:MAG: class GN sortase [Halieaceae bacterium]
MWQSEHWHRLLVICLLLVGGQQLAGAGLIKAKAWLAPILIEQAWTQSLAAQGQIVRPWPWADTWPVARLSVPEAGVDLLVLAGDSGHALAFGPGHANASARPGDTGTVVIGGHRDTHFAFLRELAPATLLHLQTIEGITRSYRVNAANVIDADENSLPSLDPEDRLLLVTCYPFDALYAGGPLRYVVSASPVSESKTFSEITGSPTEVYQL